MKKHLLLFMVLLETLFITFVGAVIGMISSFGLIYYFVLNPIRFTGKLKEVYEQFGIDPVISMSLRPSIFYYQALIIFILALVISVYPSMRILKLNPLEAMRS